MSTVFDETVANQRRAATPARSAFVAANAGSGKTRVLTDRVARLLLANADPAKILCITFTKAAAAEMADRLFKLLGRWALEDDDKLSAALSDLEGEGKSHSSEELARARRLFARALETPGGLKIQTIHSFCESVLKRFPIEAGIAPGFNVVEEGVDARLAHQAIDRIASRADEPELQPSFSRLIARFAPAALRALILENILSRQGLARSLETAGGWQALMREGANALGAKADFTEEAARKKLLDGIDRHLLEHTVEVLGNGKATAQKLVSGPLSEYFLSHKANERLTALSSFFLTTSGSPRKKFDDSDTNKIDPNLQEKLSAAQEKFVEGVDCIKTAAAYQDTAAFLTILEKAVAEYDALKAARASLDYDDLIIATRKLFQDTDKNAWVMYKLDYGLDHILLDEAQDTSPGQWDIVEGPLAEFFSGDGVRDMARTFFAVGDQKQSIYSFQGADAGLFAAKQLALGEKIAAATEFENVPLTLSFRTTEPILKFVDALFDHSDALEGLDNQKLAHGVHRSGQAGLVELWPLTPRPEKPEINAWDAPVDARPVDNPTKTLCDEVAATIKNWLDSDILESKGRPVAPSDIIILVQSRGASFHQMIMSLARKGVPVAGADRLKLLEDPAVEDLISYACAVLLPSDDLSLAEILKSPFHGLDDEALFDLAHNRKGTLWAALQSRADDRPDWRQAVDAITEAQNIGLKDGAYAFFSHLLESGEPSGRKRLYARLSKASREPIDEFMRQALDYERANPRSLQGFISWASENAGEIKRELEQGSDAVRVMTVHGAKGLEGDIVFLLDAHKPPNLKNLGPLFTAPTSNTNATPSLNAPILSRTKADDAPAAEVAREEAKRKQYEEYRRLLYVAATRARDRLYICGLESGRGGDPYKKAISEKTWHALAEDAFERLENVQTDHHSSWAGDVRRASSLQQTAPEQLEKKPPPQQVEKPTWLTKPAAAEMPLKRLAPSRLADDAQAHAEPAAYSPLRGRDKYFRGRVLHRLLELLPNIEEEKRRSAADKLLARFAAEIDRDESAHWRDEVLAVINDPAFAAAFGPDSRAEVSIAGTPSKANGNFVVSGQIDRLMVTGDTIFVIDYKTNRPPPERVEDVAEPYLAQMAAYRALLQEIYPSKHIESALLWTHEARLMPLPSDLLDHAFARNLA